MGIQPEDFSIPDWYEADEDEMRKLAEERHNKLLTEQMLKLEKQQNQSINQVMNPFAASTNN